MVFKSKQLVSNVILRYTGSHYTYSRNTNDGGLGDNSEVLYASHTALLEGFMI